VRDYKCLSKQTYSLNEYQIVPIRDQDRYDIMQWRNEQIYHLRQSKPLDKESQDKYFDTVVTKLFEAERPDQILFSYLENGVCIGYGGLVHINWIDINAEISFVLNTSLEIKFVDHWCSFLSLIEQVAFKELQFRKIFTYAFDLRPLLYIALEKSKFTKEAVLKNHTYFNNGFIDVVIHSKLREHKFFLREAKTNKDALQLFDWVNDEEVRKNSLNTNQISIIDHFTWFQAKIKSETTRIYLLTDEFDSPIGQIRVDKVNENYEIDYSISNVHRGRGLGNKIVELLITQMGYVNLLAKVKKTNVPSIKVFVNNGFKLYKEEKDLIIYTKIH
jgi:RimJ/RimL family protein N-acetyltransferase